MSVSVPPPGWVAPERPVATSAPQAEAGALRTENRRSLDGRRVRARVVDWLIVAPFGGVTVWWWGLNIGTIALTQCLLLILHHVCEVTTGATPGKRLTHLRVARLEDGGLPTPRQAATRGVIGIFESGLIALIAILCTKGRRRLGDLAAGTAVVDARKHPIASRPLFRGALTYPVVWAVPAIVACVLAAHGAVPGSYRYDADAACAPNTAILRGFSPPAPAGRTALASLSQTLLAEQQLEEDVLARVRSIPAPAAWRGRRDELVQRLAARTIEHRQMAYDLLMPDGAKLAGFWAARQRQRLADDDAALAAAGFHGCAHRA